MLPKRTPSIWRRLVVSAGKAFGGGVGCGPGWSCRGQLFPQLVSTQFFGGSDPLPCPAEGLAVRSQGLLVDSSCREEAVEGAFLEVP